ncbi:MAG TPA: hypothetical protein VF783_23640, partial [Terriglobales bacterium]
TDPTAGGFVLVGAADGIKVERVTADTRQARDRVTARGFAEYGPLPENLFAALGTLPNSLNFLARVDGEPAGGSVGARSCARRELLRCWDRRQLLSFANPVSRSR